MFRTKLSNTMFGYYSNNDSKEYNIERRWEYGRAKAEGYRNVLTPKGANTPLLVRMLPYKIELSETRPLTPPVSDEGIDEYLEKLGIALPGDYLSYWGQNSDLQCGRTLDMDVIMYNGIPFHPESPESFFDYCHDGTKTVIRSIHESLDDVRAYPDSKEVSVSIWKGDSKVVNYVTRVSAQDCLAILESRVSFDSSLNVLVVDVNGNRDDEIVTNWNVFSPIPSGCDPEFYYELYATSLTHVAGILGLFYYNCQTHFLTEYHAMMNFDRKVKISDLGFDKVYYKDCPSKMYNGNKADIANIVEIKKAYRPTPSVITSLF